MAIRWSRYRYQWPVVSWAQDLRLAWACECSPLDWLELSVFLKSGICLRAQSVECAAAQCVWQGRILCKKILECQIEENVAPTASFRYTALVILTIITTDLRDDSLSVLVAPGIECQALAQHTRPDLCSRFPVIWDLQYVGQRLGVSDSVMRPV